MKKILKLIFIAWVVFLNYYFVFKNISFDFVGIIYSLFVFVMFNIILYLFYLSFFEK